jgi:tetrahydromethanopterin S-methyltransferase subunit F
VQRFLGAESEVESCRGRLPRSSVCARDSEIVSSINLNMACGFTFLFVVVVVMVVIVF